MVRRAHPTGHFPDPSGPGTGIWRAGTPALPTQVRFQKVAGTEARPTGCFFFKKGLPFGFDLVSFIG